MIYQGEQLTAMLQPSWRRTLLVLMAWALMMPAASAGEKEDAATIVAAWAKRAAKVKHLSYTCQGTCTTKANSIQNEDVMTGEVVGQPFPPQDMTNPWLLGLASNFDEGNWNRYQKNAATNVDLTGFITNTSAQFVRGNDYNAVFEEDGDVKAQKALGHRFIEYHLNGDTARIRAFEVTGVECVMLAAVGRIRSLHGVPYPIDSPNWIVDRDVRGKIDHDSDTAILWFEDDTDPTASNTGFRYTCSIDADMRPSRFEIFLDGIGQTKSNDIQLKWEKSSDNEWTPSSGTFTKFDPWTGKVSATCDFAVEDYLVSEEPRKLESMPPIENGTWCYDLASQRTFQFARPSN
ncbi:hypothetical protein Pla22_05780 [Rubripirellula amarantea]|uniref:Uncharacterized protein n=1 Tax=Rubripirellula amarantea TaxID=2527999 RepID=A0A5C5WR58_9BACT|nr:hypothetical protein [Rubripirellula amarantea]TWT52950.1 hypothetical protein Pla22_05780 [Rubripirellula amarantea]